jgi:WD40 repeat protein
MSMAVTSTIVNPYVGPRTFAYEDRHFYFGREREAHSLLARVISERLLLFYAQSGAGKSSLINTRLIPGLAEEEGFAVLPVGRVGGDLPAGVEVDNIFAFNLMASLDRSTASPGRLAGLTISDFLAHLVSDDGLAWRYDPAPQAEFGEASPKALEGDDASHQRFALVIDQFEEIITSHPDRWQEREPFFRQLDQALTDNPDLWVVLTLREDYIAALDPYAPLLLNRLRARFHMERMSADAALEAIRKPVALAGRPFAPGAAEKLTEDLRQVRVSGQQKTITGQYVEPVQLQVVCYQLWERLQVAGSRSQVGNSDSNLQPSNLEPATRFITEADLREAGDVDRALTQFYEETLGAALADPAAAGTAERQLRTWFDEELITEAGTRGLVHQDETETAGLPNGVVAALQRRFLVRGEARGGDTWIELVHDRLVEPVRASNAAWFPEHLSALQRQAALWDEQKRPDGLLLRGTALAEAEHWAGTQIEPIERHEQEFLAECRTEREREDQERKSAERERQQNRRIRALAIVAATVAVLAIGNAVLAYNGQRAADRAQKSALAEAAKASTAEAKAVVEATGASYARGTAVAEATGASAAEGKAIAEAANASSARETAVAEAKRALKAEAKANVEALRAEEERKRAENQARLARAGELAAYTQTVLGKKEDPSGSLPLILAREAVLATWKSGKTVTVNADMALQAAVENADSRRSSHLIGHVGWVSSAAFSPDGTMIITASSDASARLWDAATGQELRQLEGHKDDVRSAIFSPDGKLVVTASLDKTARLWDAATGDELRQYLGHDEGVIFAAFSPDGMTVVTTSRDKTARMWDAATGRPLRTLTGHTDYVRYAAYSPNGKTILTGSGDQTARLWDVATGKELYQFQGHAGWVYCVGFSPDGETVVTASGDKTARLWNVATGKELHQFQGHTGWVTSVGFSPDGKTVVTASTDTTVRLWDAATGQELRQLNGHAGTVSSAVYSLDGKAIVTSSEDRTARIWLASIDDLLVEAARLIQRDPPLLTPEESRRFGLE